MATCNGFKIRGQNQDSNRVSIQSNVQTTWMLTYRRPGAVGPIWHEVGMLRDELVVIKCQGGEAVIQIEPLGDAAGTLIAQSSRKTTQTLRVGSLYTWELERGEALIMRSTNIVYPVSAGAGLAV